MEGAFVNLEPVPVMQILGAGARRCCVVVNGIDVEMMLEEASRRAERPITRLETFLVGIRKAVSPTFMPLLRGESPAASYLEEAEKTAPKLTDWPCTTYYSFDRAALVFGGYIYINHD